MLTPEDIQGIANDITSIYSRVETDCIKAIAKAISSGTKIKSAQLWQMRKLADVGLLKRDLYSKIANASKTGIKEVDNLVTQALSQSVWNDADIYLATKKYSGMTKQELLSSIQSTDSFKHILKTSLKGVKESYNLTGTKALQGSVVAYTKAINMAYLNMTTGNMDKEDAIAEALQKIAHSGISIVDNKSKVQDSELIKKNGELFTTYKNGEKIHMYPLDSAIRRDLVTQANKASAELCLADCNELGTKLVETSWHNGARPEHEVWQGKVFTLDPKDTRYGYFYGSQDAGLPEYGSITGICGINCYHSFSPYLEGTPRVDQTNRMSKEENNQLYADRQKQRNYERTLRALKREQVALNEAGYTDKAKEVQKKINSKSAEYRQFLKDKDLPRQSLLERVDGYKVMSTKTSTPSTPTNSTTTATKATSTAQPKQLTAIRKKHATAQKTASAPEKTPQETYDNALNWEKKCPRWQQDIEAHNYHSQNNFSLDKVNALTQEQRDAIVSYTTTEGCNAMNKSMWAGNKKKFGKDWEEKIDNLYDALSQFTVAEDVVCYRGACSYEQFAQQFNLHADDIKNEKARNMLIGQKYKERGFTSTAGARENAWDTKDVMLEICVPKGTHGLYVSAKGHALSYYGEGEKELLIMPSSMEILGSYYKDGKLWFKTSITGELPRLT